MTIAELLEVAPEGQRVYDHMEEDAMVARTYREIQSNHTLPLTRGLKAMHSHVIETIPCVWHAVDMMLRITDDSDPDTELPQFIHAWQTAEAMALNLMPDNTFNGTIEIRKIFNDAEWDALPSDVRSLYESAGSLKNLLPEALSGDCQWLVVVAFIHDLGKVAMIPRFGGHTQWQCVGDIFPVDMPLESAAIFHSRQYYKNNRDLDGDAQRVDVSAGDVANEPNRRVGFDKHTMRWSHDEYLFDVLSRSNTKIPAAGLYLARYHSFYPWHTPPADCGGSRGYTSIASEDDWRMLPLVKLFQKCDLYSKAGEAPPSEAMVKDMYEGMLSKWLPKGLRL